MNKSDIFKKSELLQWDNTAALQDWTSTAKFFTEIWVDRMAYCRQKEGDRPFESVLALGPRTGGTVGELTQDAKLNFLVQALERAHEEVGTLQDELDGLTVGTASPTKFVAAATTTDSAAALIAQLIVQGTAQTA